MLPARYPNLLVNGAGGIAVGMATNIPTHNLGEVIDACLALIDNPALNIDNIMEYLPGPDFPTGGVILGRTGIKSAYHTGRGSIAMRGLATIEEIRKDREAIVITEVPFQVNKARMIERMAECVREKIIEGISDLRDESDRDGVRVVGRDQARRHGRRGAEPALQVHAAAVLVRRQHAGAERRPAAADGHPPGASRLPRLPRRSHHPACRLPAPRGAGQGAQHARVGARSRQYRCGDRAHSRRQRSADRQGTADGAGMAGRHHRAVGAADRRSGLCRHAGRHIPAVRGPGQGHPRAPPAAPDRAGAREDRRRPRRSRAADHRASGNSRQPREAQGHHAH